MAPGRRAFGAGRATAAPKSLGGLVGDLVMQVVLLIGSPAALVPFLLAAEAAGTWAYLVIAAIYLFFIYVLVVAMWRKWAQIRRRAAALREGLDDV